MLSPAGPESLHWRLASALRSPPDPLAATRRYARMVDYSRFVDELTAARDGDKAALSRLIGRIEQQLRSYPDRQLGEDLRAKIRSSDILQESLIQVLQSIDQFEGTTESQFYGWVTRIIENTVRQQGRYFDASKRRLPSSDSQRGMIARALSISPGTPSAEVLKVEELELLKRAIASLPDDYRRTIELSVLEGRELPAVAAELGRTEAATRMVLSRARAALVLAVERLDPSHDR